MCKKVVKPSGTDTKVLRQSSSSCVKKLNPASECVAMPQQKENKAFRIKRSKVQLIMDSNPDQGIPRGKSLFAEDRD